MDIKEIIKNKNKKLTTARIALLEILQEAKKPLSYENIKSDISRRFSSDDCLILLSKSVISSGLLS